jgi:hypothetical protein
MTSMKECKNGEAGKLLTSKVMLAKLHKMVNLISFTLGIHCSLYEILQYSVGVKINENCRGNVDECS